MRVNNLSSVNAAYGRNGTYQIVYPPQPTFSAQCPTNVDYDTIPKNYPMRKTLLGPASLKKLYSGPQYYPPQRMDVPHNTLYGYDNSKFNDLGERQSYGSMLYPFHQRSPKEVITTAGAVLPMPALQEWTKYPVARDGAWGR